MAPAAFISGKPAFGTLVGLLHNDLPVAGLADLPVLMNVM